MGDRGQPVRNPIRSGGWIKLLHGRRSHSFAAPSPRDLISFTCAMAGGNVHSHTRIVPIVEFHGDDVDGRDNELTPTLLTPSEGRRLKPLPMLRPDPAPRSMTAPSPTSPFGGYFSTLHTQPRPHTSHSSRNRSPYSRPHMRSRSSGAALGAAPPMTRAHSMPNPRIPSPSGTASPLRTPARMHSPLRSSSEEVRGVTPPSRQANWYDGPGTAVETIEEDSELDFTQIANIVSPVPTNSASFSRSGSLRRRSASPAHSLTNSTELTRGYATLSTDFATNGRPSIESSASNSPSLGPSKYNESYPSLHSFTSFSSFGSMPSTPTSARSRSPSISSLGTIEDEPDLESEAVERERIEKLRLAAERHERMESGENVDDEEGGGRRRSSFDTYRTFGRNSNRDKKRWSVCGGERRADLDLETIWED